MPRLVLTVAFLVLCVTDQPAAAQPPKGKLSQKFAALADVDVIASPTRVKWGETVTVKVTITPTGGGHTYPAFPKDSKQGSKNSLIPPPVGDLIFIGSVSDPPVDWKLEPRQGATKGEQDQYTTQPLTWELKAVVSPKAKTGTKEILLGDTRLQVCAENVGCIPAWGKNLPPIVIDVLEGASDRVVPEDLAAALAVLGVQTAAPLPMAEGAPDRGRGIGVPPTSTAPAPITDTKKIAKSTDAYVNELNNIAATIETTDENGAGIGSTRAGLWGFVATAAAWGLISLVTPCVFPMIPITVSIFLHRAHGSLRERFKLAGVYCATIVTVLGVSAFALLKFMAWLSAHPVTNVFLAALFFVLALSLFGMYELTLPNVLQKRLQAKQSHSGVVGMIFGALAFTVISFTCVAPFLGGFAGISAGSDGGGSSITLPTAREVAGGLAFATAFAAPFFVLAMIPGLLKALPRSGGWLDSVKVVMGFLELAAALKFLRTAELRVFPTSHYFTYDVVLGGWVAISAACGLYLLNVYRLPHDEAQPNIGVPRLLFALAFLGLALYLAPGLLKGPDGRLQRPSGTVYAWVESFLLPEGEQWPTDLKDALERSRVSGKPVFVDFTGKTCTNCRYNEANIFTLPEFRSQIERFERVQLYTDEVPATAYQSDPGHSSRVHEAAANGDFQVAVLKDDTLPTYVILAPQPNGKVKLFKYGEAKINDPDRFSAFLKGALEMSKAKS
jgi:thiol:disulfide interchange protein